jgi:RimJ/RimL family protein N-acetyltransferase
MRLESSRLIIRPINCDDKYEIFNYRCDTETNKYQGWIPKTINDVESFINNISKQINEPETWFQFAVIEKQHHEIIGDLGIHFIDKDNKQVEIGCTLNKKSHNQGYATESIKKVIDYLFNDLNKHRIIASIDPENKNSIRLVERIGFRKEAHFVESLYLNGKWVDDLIYALLKKDWEKLNQR